MRSMLGCALAALAMMLFVGCDGGSGQTCALCGMSLSDADCMRFAVAHGCSSGVSEVVDLCGGGTQGCRFECPDDRPVMCEAATGDAGM